jgi:hypothetical protein
MESRITTRKLEERKAQIQKKFVKMKVTTIGKEKKNQLLM